MKPLYSDHSYIPGCCFQADEIKYPSQPLAAIASKSAQTPVVAGAAGGGQWWPMVTSVQWFCLGERTRVERMLD